MVKFSLGKIIIFDIDEALSFEGRERPTQYAAVRASNIFQKMKEREGTDEAAVLAALASTPPEVLTTGAEGDDLWGLALEAARLDEIVDQALRSNEVAVVAKYAFGLAQAFNAFYHRYPILNEERADAKRWRAAVASAPDADHARAGPHGMRRADTHVERPFRVTIRLSEGHETDHRHYPKSPARRLRTGDSPGGWRTGAP